MKPWKRPRKYCTREPIISFNGATAMKPWKSREVEYDTGWRTSLQWGHGDEAVEE